MPAVLPGVLPLTACHHSWQVHLVWDLQCSLWGQRLCTRTLLQIVSMCLQCFKYWLQQSHLASLDVLSGQSMTA